MHKYPDLYRLRYDHIQMVTSKRYWEDPRHLFKKISILEEKIDGSQMAIGWKHDAPYVQGKNSHIDQSDKRMAYHGVWAWIWENIAKLQKLKGKLVFGEWMRVQHSLEYDLLPDWFIAFDVYDLVNGRWMPAYDAIQFCEEVGLATVPVINFEDGDELAYISQQELPSLVDGKRSNFSTKCNMEGCVLKPIGLSKHDQKGASLWWTDRAKYVSQEFLDDLSDDSHWTSHRFTENGLKIWKTAKMDVIA